MLTGIKTTFRSFLRYRMLQNTIPNTNIRKNPIYRSHGLCVLGRLLQMNTENAFPIYLDYDGSFL
jgi:hypothetical protein